MRRVSYAESNGAEVLRGVWLSATCDLPQLRHPGDTDAEVLRRVRRSSEVDARGRTIVPCACCNLWGRHRPSPSFHRGTAVGYLPLL